MDAALDPPVTGLRDVPYMGVIAVVAEASKRGFFNGNPEWSNLGQGQPEVDLIADGPARLAGLDFVTTDYAYGPVNGIDDLREAIAAYYNRTYRQARNSLYTKDNVSIAQGGRLMLSRVLAVIADGSIGYVVPDYTAYQDMLEQHQHRLRPVCIPSDPARGFQISVADLEVAMRTEGLGALLFSNPCNPTGQVVQGQDLAELVEAARRHGCLSLFDEFYSHYIYGLDGAPGAGPVSAAPYVDDVDSDPVVLIDGFTKNFRYPGLRLGWAVGPKAVIEVLGRAASGIDGGPSVSSQRAALPLLGADKVEQETSAVRKVFARKRAIMKRRLEELGVTFAPDAQGTFYLWGCVADLPPPFNDSMEFFRRALDHRVMIVPGPFFDIDPGRTRGDKSPLRQWARFSFGPSETNMTQGLERLAAMIASEAVA